MKVKANVKSGKTTIIKLNSNEYKFDRLPITVDSIIGKMPLLLSKSTIFSIKNMFA